MGSKRNTSNINDVLDETARRQESGDVVLLPLLLLSPCLERDLIRYPLLDSIDSTHSDEIASPRSRARKSDQFQNVLSKPSLCKRYQMFAWGASFRGCREERTLLHPRALA